MRALTIDAVSDACCAQGCCRGTVPQLRCIEVITRHASPAATVKLSGSATSAYALELACTGKLRLLDSASVLRAASPRGIKNANATPRLTPGAQHFVFSKLS